MAECQQWFRYIKTSHVEANDSGINSKNHAIHTRLAVVKDNNRNLRQRRNLWLVSLKKKRTQSQAKAKQLIQHSMMRVS